MAYMKIVDIYGVHTPADVAGALKDFATFLDP